MSQPAGSDVNASPVKAAIADAPSTVANVAVGFDCLGFALPIAFDRAEVRRTPPGDRSVRILSIEAHDGDPAVASIPLEAERNAAGVALQALIEQTGIDHGFTVRLTKGVPLASGMGGSAASGAAAVKAAAALLDPTPSLERLCACAVAGEAACSGSPHADNAAAALYGGLVLVLGHTPAQVVALPLPDGLFCSLVHPHVRLETRAARAALADELPLTLHAEQAARLAAFVHACHRGDITLMRSAMRDVVVEPQRAGLIPGFTAAQRAGLAAGAIGLSIAGAGPSMFAWSPAADTAQRVTAAMQEALERQGVSSDGWSVPLGGAGARVVETD